MFYSDTEIITSRGMRSLSYFKDGERIFVPSRKGEWTAAVVYHPGRRKVNIVSVSRFKTKTQYMATPNQRWILKDGKITEEVAKGDRLLRPPDISYFKFEEAIRLAKQFWCYGFMCRNGNKLKDGSGVVLFNDKFKYAQRFKDSGFMAKPSPLFENEFNCYIEGYRREKFTPGSIPVPMMRAFVNGYLDAFAYDKEKPFRDENGEKTNIFFVIEPPDIEYIRQVLPIAGFYIATELTQGKRAKMNIYTHDDNHRRPLTVDSVEPFKVINVSFLEVAGDESFLLPFGVVAQGNEKALNIQSTL